MWFKVLTRAFLLLVVTSILAVPAVPTPAAHVPDEEPPLLSVLSPVSHNWYRDAFEASVEATDAPHQDTVAWVRLQIGTGAVAQDNIPPYRFPIDLTTLGDGVHAVTATAMDSAGNSATATRDLRVDRTAPLLEITSHDDDGLIVGPTTLSANATDATSGIIGVAFYVGDKFVGSRATEPYRVEWTPLLTIGYHEIRAVTYDRAGNRATDSVQVLVL